MKKSLLLLVFCANSIIAQDSIKVTAPTKSNPIIFIEGYTGFGGGKSAGFIYGGSLNYQPYKKNLFTIRIGGFSGFAIRAALLGPILAFPVYVKTEQITEYALLYGKRWVNIGHSWSVSSGISYSREECVEAISGVDYQFERKTFGIPFEVNIKWFKNEKKRFRAYYGLIPIGRKKVSFGRSFGFKFAGNISKANYFGFGINYGFGWHKKY